MGVLIEPDLEVAVQMRWAVRLAAARTMDLLVLQIVESRDVRTVEVPLDESPEGEGAAVVLEVMRIVDSSPDLCVGLGEDEDSGQAEEGEGHIVQVRLKQIRCASLHSLRHELLAEVRKSKLKLITLAHKELDTTNADIVNERRLFLRYVPCEVVFCYGLDESNQLSRILVGVASGPHGDSALQLGRDLVMVADGTLTVLRVNPSIGPDAERVGVRRVDSLVKKKLGKEHEGVIRRVVVDDQVHQGIRRVWKEGKHDLVVLGASRLGMLGSQLRGGTAAKLFKGDTKPTVAVVSAGSPIRNRLLAFVEGSIERLVPQIDREDRVALVDRIQSSAHWDFDFVTLMVLSTVIAAIGLIQNSAAVVIGAMLVAPLMTPLLGLGLALVQGNPVLARISFRSIILSLSVSLVVGVVVGLLTPGFEEPTREMLGRGGPGLLDLFVAFTSGLAAAYASSRPGLLAALPGVAIAAALVPPIATSGLALSLGNFHLASGALLLFVINMVTIVLASVAALWAVGLRDIKKTSRWTVMAGGAVLVSVLALGVYLSVRPTQHPTTAVIPVGLMETMQKRLGEAYRLESLSVAYDELGVQLNVRVVGKTLAPESVANEIRAVARKHFGRPLRVRLITEIEANFATE
jgi:uncharacterized hydrophobic protein (TIGR00271 family)